MTLPLTIILFILFLFKKNFNTKGCIHLYDLANGTEIPDDILPDYINQYICIPGWGLEAKEIEIGFLKYFEILLL